MHTISIIIANKEVSPASYTYSARQNAYDEITDGWEFASSKWTCMGVWGEEVHDRL